MKNVVWLMVILIAACAINFSIKDNSKFNKRIFQFTYEVEIEATNGKKLEVWIPIPQSNEVQNISNLTIDTDGLEYSIKDEKVHGNKYLYILDKTGISSSETVSVKFDVIRKEHGSLSDKSVNPQNYLGSYNTVPTGSLFSNVIDENNLSNSNIRGIYNFILSGMHYGKPKSVDDIYYRSPWLNSDSIYGRKGVTRDDVVKLYQKSNSEGGNYTFGNGNSIYACDIGVGNCTDYHSYFMSLGRTLNVPVRFHMGFPIPPENEGDVGGYHCWADYYVEGEGWYPVDISEGDKDPARKDYYFGTLDPNRVEIMVGRDFVLDEFDGGSVNLFIYPILEVNDKKSTAFTKSFYYKEL